MKDDHLFERALIGWLAIFIRQSLVEFGLRQFPTGPRIFSEPRSVGQPQIGHDRRVTAHFDLTDTGVNELRKGIKRLLVFVGLLCHNRGDLSEPVIQILCAVDVNQA